ncbi:hypothetical protein Tco_1181890 [Tanacetum coccineum]
MDFTGGEVEQHVINDDETCAFSELLYNKLFVPGIVKINALTKPVTLQYLPKQKEPVHAKTQHELYTTFSTLAGKLRWRGRSWVFDLNKSDLCPSFVEGLTAKGLGPSRGGFPYCAKDSIATQTCELSKEEFNDFLTLYPIPSEYRVILPKSNQTVFDAPPGYVGLYTHSFSLANLRLPLTEFFCEVLEYFQVHISRLNPFGCAKLTTFVVMCKAYGCEPSVDLFRGFFNLCRAGKWLTFAKRSEKHVPNLLPKVITRIEGWHERFFYVQDSIIPAKYSQLLSEQNKLDSKSFKDKLPPNIEENPMFQRLGRYPTSVRVFPDPILFLAGLKPSWEYGQQRPAIMAGGKGIYLSCFFLHFPFSLIYDLLFLLAEMAFRNFIYTEDDEDLSFLPKEPSPGFGTGSPSVSVNTEPLKADEELVIQPAEVTTDSRESPKPEVFVVHPGSVAARIKDRKCKTIGGSSRPPVKRKLAPGSSTSRAIRAMTSSLKDDVPYLIVSDDDKGLPDVLKLKDATACHLKISAITPLAWKNYLDNHMDVELLDLHDRCYARQAVDMERVREEECEELHAKCEADMTEFKKNPTVVALREKISTLSTEVKEHKAEKARLEAVEVSLRKEVEELKQDRREVVSKVVPYAAMELVHSDDMGSLVGRLVSSAILYGRCRAYEQVADMKEPFDLSKVKGYRSSYKKDHTQASNDLATATFPWLDEFVADPSAPIEALLSKKPPSLQRPAPSRTQVPLPSSQRATPSSVPVSNPMSPPADVSVGFYGEHSVQSCLRIWRTLSLTPLCASSSGGSCVADAEVAPSSPIEALLLKKPPSLQIPSPSRTQVPLPSSQRATPSSVPVSNPMSPPADVSVMKPQSSQLQ